METTTLELPIEVARALDELAERRGTSRAALLEEMARDLVGRRYPIEDDPGWPQSIGSIAVDGPNAEDFEDWLREHWRPEDDWDRPRSPLTHPGSSRSSIAWTRATGR